MFWRTWSYLLLVSAVVLPWCSWAVSVPVPSVQYGLVAEVVSEEITATLSTPLLQTRLAAVETTPQMLVFVGDVLLARNIESLMEKEGVGYPFAGINLAQTAMEGYVVGNFESAVPETHVPTPAGRVRFSVATSSVPALYAAGFTHVSLANNHSFDFGAVGYRHTVSSIAEAKIAPFGHPTQFGRDSVTFFPVDTKTVAVIGLHALTEAPSPADIAAVMQFAAAQSDLQVLYVHWGDEYVPVSNMAQQTLAAQLVAAGVDLIIGHHPHVVQEVGLIEGVPVFYSLGNYIFDQYSSVDTEEGLLLRLVLSPTPAVQLVPVTSEHTHSQPHFMTEAAANNFLSEVAGRSAASIAWYVSEGVVPLRNFAPQVSSLVQR